MTPEASPESKRARLRSFVERLLGWDDKPAVEHALRASDLALRRNLR